jgi:dTDP-glucose 4,6-dehydratase
VRLLVTGGAGFMGSNYVHHTAATNPEARILVYDKLTYAGRPENLQGLDPSRVKLLAADILDYDRLVEVLRSFQPDYVVNFAAETHVDRSIRDPSVFVEVNVRGLHTLLEALRRVDNSTLIHISTDEVYGDITGTVALWASRVKEAFKLRARSPQQSPAGASSRRSSGEASQQTASAPL